MANELTELLEGHRGDAPANEVLNENNQNVANKPCEPRNVTLERAARNESADSGSHPALRSPAAPPAPPAPAPAPAPVAAPAPPAAAAPPAVKNAGAGRGHPGALPPANRVAPAPRAAQLPPAAPGARPNSNVSFVLQPVVGGMVPPLFPPPRVAPPPPVHPAVFPNAYYEYPAGGWHFAYESYERPPGNVNVNFNLPPKNLVVNGRGGCRPPDDVTFGAPPPTQGCWIKPTIFYDGFWTEQKVKKWVAEQVEKQFPEDASATSASPAADKS